MLKDSSHSLTRQGIDWYREPTFEEWQELGYALYEIEHGRRWWWGDWILKGEQVFGEKYAQALEDSGYQYSTLANSVSICRAIPYDLRDPEISFSTHAILAPIARKDLQAYKGWISMVGETSISGSQLKEILKIDNNDPEIARISIDAHRVAKRADMSLPALEPRKIDPSPLLRCPSCGYRENAEAFHHE